MENITEEYIIEKVGQAIINLWNAYKNDKLWGGNKEEPVDEEAISRNGYGDISQEVYLEEYFNSNTWKLVNDVCAGYSEQMLHHEVNNEWNNTYNCYTLTIEPKVPEGELKLMKTIKRKEWF